jgi:hypothetical protein
MFDMSDITIYTKSVTTSIQTNFWLDSLYIVVTVIVVKGKGGGDYV